MGARGATGRGWAPKRPPGGGADGRCACVPHARGWSGSEGIKRIWYQTGGRSPSARRAWKARTKPASPPSAIASLSPVISSW
jgi:hypothetical protein